MLFMYPFHIMLRYSPSTTTLPIILVIITKTTWIIIGLLLHVTSLSSIICYPQLQQQRRQHQNHLILHNAFSNTIRTSKISNDEHIITTTWRSSSIGMIRQKRIRHNHNSIIVHHMKNRRRTSSIDDEDMDDEYSFDDDNRNNNKRRDSYYDDDEDDDDDDDDDLDEFENPKSKKDTSKTLYWERCDTLNNNGYSYVVLPPPIYSNNNKDNRKGSTGSLVLPTSIIHFIGGTFFGSTPRFWYQQLIEDIVLYTNSAVIVSTIQPTLLSSPLQHIKLSKQCYQQFITSYQQIILNEYLNYDNNNDYDNHADDDDDDDDDDDSNIKAIQSIPICAIGHSLGARLLTVYTTLYPPLQQHNKKQSTKNSYERPSSMYEPLSYQSFILLSFTNFGANSGIPGLYELSKQSELLKQRQNMYDLAERAKKMKQQQNNNNNNQNKRNNNRNNNKKQQQEQQQKSKYYNDEDENDDDEDDDDDDDDDDDIINGLDDKLNEIMDMIQQSSLKIKSVLTPNTQHLEFNPSPIKLWNAIYNDNRYQIPYTLFIQFDNDPIDQSSKFANALLDYNNDHNNNNNQSSTFSYDVKFARLRGTHITPITASSFGYNYNQQQQSMKKSRQQQQMDMDQEDTTMSTLNGKMTNFIRSLLFTAIISSNNPSRKQQGNIKDNNNDMMMMQYTELRQTITSYIMDIVVTATSTAKIKQSNEKNLN